MSVQEDPPRSGLHHQGSRSSLAAAEVAFAGKSTRSGTATGRLNSADSGPSIPTDGMMRWRGAAQNLFPLACAR